jgi:hypothetical protein
MEYRWPHDPPTHDDVVTAVRKAEVIGYIVLWHDVPRPQVDELVAAGRLEFYRHPAGVRLVCVRTTGRGGRVRRRIGAWMRRVAGDPATYL